MSQMVPIGRLSKMTRPSVKALRLHDEIGRLRSEEHPSRPSRIVVT